MVDKYGYCNHAAHTAHTAYGYRVCPDCNPPLLLDPPLLSDPPPLTNTCSPGSGGSEHG